MPRGGGRKVTQICSRIYMRFRLWRDYSLWLLFSCRNEKKSNPSFFSCFRARVYLLSQRWSSLSLFVSCGVFEREIGFSKTRALRKRERERDKLWMWFPISPGREKREREDQRLISPTTKRSARKERKKKTNRQPKHNISKKERERAFEEKEREREKESVFLREKRDIFPPFSLSFLCLPRREERVEKQTDIFRITAWHWPHLCLSLLLLHATMK